MEPIEGILDPQYDYVHRVANEIKPEFDVGEDGEVFQTLSEAASCFMWRMDKIKPPFTYQQYIENEDIIATLEGYGIDPDKFWLAVLFIYDITQEKCVNTLTFGDSLRVQAEKLSDLLTGINEFTITTDQKKKLKIDEKRLINHLKNCLGENMSRADNIFLDSWGIDLKAESGDLYSSSVQIWYAANRFLALFQSLGLPNKRAKDSAVVYKKEEMYDCVVRGGNMLVSYNKLLLVSRLMYLMRYTRNDVFLYSDNSLKGILKQYKSFKFHTFSKVYFA